MRFHLKKRVRQDRWEECLDEHGEVLVLYARQQTRSESDAKDVLQEALTETWDKAGHGTPSRARVFATIRRRAIDLGRSIDRRARREERFFSGKPDWFEPDYTATDTGEQLIEAIQTLPAKLREVLILKIWGELAFPEIADMMNIPVATATSRYRYALEQLRKSETLIELKP